MKIILATDGTDLSVPAVNAVRRFKLCEGDEILVVSVVDMAIPMTFDAYTGYVPDTTELEKAARENASRILAETKEQLEKKIADDSVIISTETLFGSPEIQIVEKAEETKADLIIVGSHGYNRWERLLLGSVSDSVVHHSPCSVLVVRQPDR